MLRKYKRPISMLLFLAVICALLPNIGTIEAITDAETVPITGTKIWDSDAAGLRPDSVNIILYADGQQVATTTATASGGWNYSFGSQPVYANGKQIVYTVGEATVTNYEMTSVTQPTVTVTPAAVSGWVKHEPNDQYEISMPAVTPTIAIKKGNDVAVWTFSALSEKERLAVAASVSEESELSGYNNIHFSSGYGPHDSNRFDVSQARIKFSAKSDWSLVFFGSYTAGSVTVTPSSITNTFVPPTVNVQVTKSWQDNNNQDGKRPTGVTVKLFADDVDTGRSHTLNEGNLWTAAFEGLNQYDTQGNSITYSIQEDTVAGYEAPIIAGSVAAGGFTVTNSRTPEIVNVSGSKTWDDADNQDGKRPTSITINLMNGASIEDSQQVTSASGWAWSFTNLPKYENGSIINYTISEAAVADYTPSYNGYNVTNSYTPGKTSVKVWKSWDDANNQDGIRPASVTVKLFAGETDTGETIVLNANNNWTDTFTGLDEKLDGQPITYTVDEVAIDDYTKEIAGNAQGGFTITNTHVPATTAVAGSKTWDDNDNEDGKRPTSITINLMNGASIEDSQQVTSASGWAWSFSNLPKYENGQEITYSISEGAITDYTPAYSGYDVTNTYVPEGPVEPVKGTLTINKVITGSSGYNPDLKFEVEINPHEEVLPTVVDPEVQPVQISVNEPWSGQLEPGQYLVSEVVANMPSRYSLVGVSGNGVVEIIAGKTAVVTITNRYQAPSVPVDPPPVTPPTEPPVTPPTPVKISIPVTKVWEGDDDVEDGRPEQVMVVLLADGVATDKTLTLNTANEWKASFTDLAADKDGAKIIYAVTELEVDGYTAVIAGDAASGFIITNTLEAEEFPDEEVPGGPPGDEEFPDEEIPGGPPTLPETSGANPAVFYGLGLALVALGVKLRRGK